jgi:predicted nucleic acid-binding Zn ribbon protein
MPLKTCPVCGGAIVGRSDKVYCSDLCRHRTNNQAKASSGEHMSTVNAILKKNRSILKTLCPEGTAVVPRQVLTSMGYNVQYFTSIFVTQRKDVYYICYDYGFLPLIKDDVARALIVKPPRTMQFRDPWLYVKNKKG